MLLGIEHQKGGTGKSTISWNLAIELAKNTDKKIEVVDLDVQQTLTLNNYVRESKGLKSFTVKTFKEVKKLEAYISNDNDSKIIIIDTGGFDSGLNRVVALLSDLIITPVSDSTVELQGLKTYEKVLKELSELSGDLISSNVLLNSIDPRKKNFDAIKEFINESKYFTAMNSIIRRRNDYKDSITAGMSVIEYKSESKAASELHALINEIKYLLNIQ